MFNITVHYNNQAGFTLLELLVVVGILGISIASFSGFEGLTAKKSYVNTYKEIRSELLNIRNVAQARGTTSRLNLSVSDGVYTVSSFYAPATTAICDVAGIWTSVKTFVVNVPGVYEVTGSGIGNVCFQKDSSSTGGVYIVDPIDDASTLDGITMTVVMATGYIDVIEN